MNKFVLISPWSKKLLNGNLSPKCPKTEWWKELISLIEYPIIQIGVDGEKQLVDDFRKNLSLSSLKQLVLNCHTWIAVDSFFQHFCWELKKPGIVIFGQSNPKIFGHSENINLLKDEKYLMHNQFLFWDLVSYRDEVFIEPKEVIKYI